jgi:hypothetical protein
LRPKARILLLDMDEDRRSLLSYVLETSGHYRVTQISHPTQGVELDAQPRLLIVVWPFEVAATMVLRRVYDCPLLVLANDLDEYPYGLVANHNLLKGQATSANILECARILSICKRGPRPGRANLTPANEARMKGNHGTADVLPSS